VPFDWWIQSIYSLINYWYKKTYWLHLIHCFLAVL
jgi:hypothetical protein